ncbi:MAG TPA: fumarylacetoacetate hydrolase family protein [Solirubrobacteraceae bacterium]|nr:fumarylacetoacetate hydrolase family protein [Solirubrobacteraceae bacterium]
MQLVSYIAGGQAALGALDGESIVEFGGGQIPADMTEFLAGGEAALEAAREALAKGERRVERSSVEFLPVVPRPPKIVCVARNYGAHAAEANVQLLEVPNIFIRFPRSLVGHGAPVLVPRVSSQVDWEAEIAVVIGTPGKHIPKERAYEHVAGYTLFNDVSIRDWQLRTPPIQFGAGKNFDGSGPLGPALVTSDEVGDPHALHLELRIDGEVMQSTSTADMLFDIPTLIEHISAFATLEPGDVIATGTPAGVGHFRDPPRYLVAGEVVEVEADRLGVLSNPVENEP